MHLQDDDALAYSGTPTTNTALKLVVLNHGAASFWINGYFDEIGLFNEVFLRSELASVWTHGIVGVLMKNCFWYSQLCVAVNAWSVNPITSFTPYTVVIADCIEHSITVGDVCMKCLYKSGGKYLLYYIWYVNKFSSSSYS